MTATYTFDVFPASTASAPPKPTGAATGALSARSRSITALTCLPGPTGQTGEDPIFQGAADFDLELIEQRTLDGHIQELIYRPTLH